ncbi:70 kDa peptidyl-prolyl isomerase-like [Cornus florida]|uniref:70 kDa peptidyl-prolyl isomerase-like n=1 Tax=Cornus florida TaxID=4283 RepID=UPI0028A23B6D|nr:70 kDa peptidyl-prolyl isomerase-like [Cornus florida]
MEVSEETEIGSEGLRKRITQKGVSWKTPFPGDEVEVHYSVHVQHGPYLNSSSEGTAFKFKLGQGEVIKGLDEGIGTMKIREKAIFTVPPDLAYGEVGSEPLIPPNSTLIFDVELVSWNTITDITGDGGILKKMTRDGEGWATPKDADEVFVKYSMLQDGTVLSNSNEGVEFSLTNGFLCPAMSIAVKTMRKGEKAELSVKFSYGFTQNGSGITGIGGDIPCNSDLIIHLELVSWKSVIDVTGDKKVLKKILKAGEGFDHPNEGSVAKVMYIGKLEDGTVFERKGSNEEPFEYMCFEEQINEGLDRAIMTMRKGEQAAVTVSSNVVHGNETVGMVSPDSVLLYEVELINFTKEKPFWKMDTNEKIEACEMKKHDGNLLFKAGKFQRASKKYEKASKYVEFDHSFNEDEKSQANALRLSCNLNNAACKLKLGENLQASRLCTKVLELDPLNVKALFRRSQVYLRISELEKAEADIKRALTIDPDNRDVKLEYKKLKEKKKEYAGYEAAIFSNMISRMV